MYERGHWTVFAAGRSYSGVLRVSVNSGQGMGPRDSLEQKVLDFIWYPAIDGDDHRLMTFGPSARPISLRMLEDADFDRHRDQIFTLLGYVGDSRDTPLLESFLLEGPKGEIEDWQLRVISAALDGLGRLSTNDPRALSFLRQATNPDFFRRIRYARRFQEQERFRLLLSELAINALGSSGHPEAGSILAELERHPYHPVQALTAKGAIAWRAKMLKQSPPAVAQERR